MASADQHLLPDFDASSEKVAVLRGHLLEHNVPFNSSAKKAELVKLFNTRIKPRAAELLAQRQAVESSSHGIERVITSKKSKGKGKRVREPESEEDELASSSAVSSSQASSEPEQSSELHKATPGRKRKVTAEAEPQVLNDSEEEVCVPPSPHMLLQLTPLWLAEAQYTCSNTQEREDCFCQPE